MASRRIGTVDGNGLPGTSRALLDAVVAMSTDLDLHRVLSRIVESACELTGARYGALGIIDATEGLQDFIIHGIEPTLRERIGDLPHGRGILGLVIRDPRPLRLDDLTKHPQSYGFPANHPPMRTFLGVPIEVQGTVFGNLYLTEKAGGHSFTDEDEEAVVALAGAAGYVIGNARDFGLSEQRRRWLEATGRLGEALQAPISTEAAFREVTRTFRAVSAARAVAIVRSGDESPQLEAADGSEVPLLEPALVQVAASVGTVEPPADAVRMVVDGLDRWAIVLPMRSALEDSDGLIALFDSEEPVRDAQQRQLMQTFADHVGLTLDRARAVADREELVLLSDRDRIARDLHDLVIQRLFATGLHLQGLRMLAERPDFVERIDKAVDDIDATIRDIRGTIFGLQNRSDASLRGDILKLVKEYTSVLGFAPVVRTEGPVDTAVPQAVQGELLAVLREALSNVAKHARASAASVHLAATAGEVELVVRDDGVGLPAGRVESGVRNARRRAEALGGAFELAPDSPRGAILTWRVPLS